MNLLTAENITKQFSERLLLDNAFLRINEGDRIGLIGLNGSGKSTLLRIVAGQESPDSGVVRAPGNVRIEYLAQEPALDDALTVLETVFRAETPVWRLVRRYEALTQELVADPHNAELHHRHDILTEEMTAAEAWTAEATAKAVLTQLGVTHFGALVGKLSGGQRKRVALARALLDRADLLILDEPTNHIDAETVAWLEEYLVSTPGALLMVTHDRYFLDRVVNRIVELDRRQLVNYAGNYAAYLEEREARQERLAAVEDVRRRTLKRELEWLRRMPQGRSTKQKARSQRVKELMQIGYDSGEQRVAMALAGRRLGKQALDAVGLVKRFDERLVLDGLDLHLNPGDRIGILGRNGAGKSTLLEILAGKLEADAGSFAWGETVQLGYYDQRSADLNDSLRLLEFIEKEAPLIRTKEGERVEAAQMLEWFLFPRSMQQGRIGSLSGGERRRLYLLRTLIHQPNVLLLDEPTNDLDIQTLAVLEEFLDHFTGCLIVVSHDRYFLDRTVDFIMPFEAGRLGGKYPTPYETFVRLRAEEAAAASGEGGGKGGAGGKPNHELRSNEVFANQPPATPKIETIRMEGPRKLSWKEQKELELLTKRIEGLEKKKQELVDKLGLVGNNYLQLQELADELAGVDQELDGAMLRWLELEEPG